jgi:hypothetical protein
MDNTNTSSTNIQAFISYIMPALETAEQILSEHDYKNGCYQIPTLIEKLQAQLEWNDETMRAMDPIIRHYINKSSKYIITKGSHGGAMLREDKQKKEAAKLAKQQAKIEVLSTIDAIVAKKTEKPIENEVTDNNGEIE